ncbi:hypothetical protein FVA95_11390 [Pseudonocardia sp. EV170527-09]|uniref:hypothetical protein n=1 Tax=Pseudonocardia sp. EV170527-09 TaxID=2603411 RepID=UPI0011F2D155|nr:hypothetical protein [Pseudonocardia sp. EV170527-09]KAA1029271.1 hypothetical protein FVA95_11390 [Pseudonocardia sp. EV170527-09]
MLQRRPARPVPPPPLTGGAGFVAGIAAGVAAGLTAGAAGLAGAGPGGSAAAAVVVAGVGTVLLAAATTAVGALAVAVVCWGFGDGFGLHHLGELHLAGPDLWLMAVLLGAALVARAAAVAPSAVARWRPARRRTVADGTAGYPAG